MPDYRQLARRKARKHGLDEDIFERQIGAESGFNPKARSPMGASGIAQIMPGTAKAWGVDPWDPDAALDAAAKNMAQYVEKYGGYENALRAYNAGPGAIEKSRAYKETNDYVAKILNGKDPGKLSKPTRDEGGRAAGEESVTFPGTREVEEFDEAAYEDARRRYQLAQFLGKRNPKSLVLSVLPQEAPTPAAFTKTRTEDNSMTFKIPGAPARSGGAGSSKGDRGGPGSDIVKAAQWLDRLAAQYGAPVTAKQEPGHTPGGDHDPKVKGATARDMGGSEAARKKIFREITKKLGVKDAQYKGPDINVVVDGLRYQIISRDHGTGPHLHTGIRKAGK